MKKLLLTSVVACCLFHPAYADVPVIDESNVIAQAKNLLQEVKSYATELQQLQTEIQSYEQWVYVGQNLIHNPVGGLTQIMGMTGVTNDVPINPYGVQQMLAGGGGLGGISGIMGKVNGLGNLVNSSWANNNVYNCTTNDYACQSSHMQTASTAAMTGLSGHLMDDIGTHLAAMTNLRTLLEGTSDPKTIQDATAYLAHENTWIQGTQAQLAAATAMYNAQQNAFGDADTQRFHQDGDAFVKQASAQQ